MEAFKCDGCSRLFEPGKRRRSWGANHAFSDTRAANITVTVEQFSTAKELCDDCFRTVLREATDLKGKTYAEFSG